MNINITPELHTTITELLNQNAWKVAQAAVKAQERAERIAALAKAAEAQANEFRAANVHVNKSYPVVG